jgi:hypothetical protein
VGQTTGWTNGRICAETYGFEGISGLQTIGFGRKFPELGMNEDLNKTLD